MYVVEAVEQLLHHLLDLAQTELDHDVGEQPGQVVFAEVKDQVECGSVAVVGRGLGPTYFYEIHYVLVLEQLQDPDLSQGGDGELYKARDEGVSGQIAFRGRILCTPSFSFSISTFFMATNLLVVEFFSRALNTSLQSK